MRLYVFSLTLLNAFLLNAQNTNPSVPVHQLKVVVDGSKTPDQIPDDLAYRHFLLAVAEHQNASALEVARRDAHLHPIGFSTPDHDSFILALTGTREALDRIDASRQAIVAVGSAGDVAAQSSLAALRSQETETMTAARARLWSALTTAGQTLLNNYVEVYVKKSIVILGSPQ